MIIAAISIRVRKAFVKRPKGKLVFLIIIVNCDRFIQVCMNYDDFCRQGIAEFGVII